jgi:isopenicillin N synthase-like dioxygenase
MPEIYDNGLHFKHQKILKSESDTTTPPSMSQYTEIPMLDMRELRSSSSSSSSSHHHHRGRPQQYAKEQLARACRDWGTFYVINHGIPEELIQRYQKLILQLISLPLEQKLQAERNKNSIFGYEFRQNQNSPIEIFQVGDHEAIIHHYSRKLFPKSYTQFW